MKHIEFLKKCQNHWTLMRCAVNPSTSRHATQVLHNTRLSYETFIVLETVVGRYLVVKT
jgi:hypothetical protein